jgi:DNA replication protein DnaC
MGVGVGGSQGACAMTTQSTFDLLVSLGLHGMAKGFKELETQSRARSLDHAQWLALLLEQEKKLRQQKRFETRARAAKLRLAANYDDIEDLAPRGLDSAQFLELAACDWIRARQNLLVIGPSGVGKSWLACALGYRALIKDFTVAYHRVPRLFAALAVARADGRYNRMLRAIARLDLLILDDWGPEPLDAEQRRDLLEIVEDRYESRSTIVTSQLPVDAWYGVIGNPTIAVAVLDRLAHNAHRIELKGESLRKQNHGPSPKLSSAQPAD